MRVSVIAAAAGFATLLMAACNAQSGDAVTSATFTATDGSSTSIADFKGRPLVVNMWATNCVPCVKEMPALDQVANEVADVVQIIGVNVFDTPENAAAFASDLGVEYPQFTDPDGTLSSALLVTGLPATAFFDADGKLLDVHQGAFTVDELRTTIENYFPTAGTTP